MLDTIYIGMSGLLGYSKGLRVIANNTANLNTPGFKSSSLQFADLVYSNGNTSANGYRQNPLGGGLTSYSTTLNFKAGELRQTGNALDLALDGQGLFVLENGDGETRYTRDGQFEFNRDGVLVSRTDGSKVMGLDASGQLAAISLAGLNINPARATRTVTLAGNLSSTTADQSVSGITVTDASGGDHALTLHFVDDSATAAGSWKVTVLDGTTEVGSGAIAFSNGAPVAASAQLSVTYKPAGQAEMPLVFDFSANVTSYAAGNLSSLAMTRQDGYAAGGLTSVTFDATGTLALDYANGQTAKGAHLALARFDSTDAVTAAGNNEFEATDPQAWHLGTAGAEFGSVHAGSVELSNVDLSQEFSDLVIMQRGYQASSQVVSTANDMLQELFSMKSK